MYEKRGLMTIKKNWVFVDSYRRNPEEYECLKLNVNVSKINDFIFYVKNVPNQHYHFFLDFDVMKKDRNHNVIDNSFYFG